MVLSLLLLSFPSLALAASTVVHTYVLRPPNYGTSPLDATTPRLSYEDIYQGKPAAAQAKSDSYSTVSYSPHGHDGGFSSGSGTQGYGGADCGKFQTIGVGAGAASLLAFGIYLLLNNSNLMAAAARSSSSRGGIDAWTARATVAATCAGGERLESSASISEAAHAALTAALVPVLGRRHGWLRRGTASEAVFASAASPALEGRQLGDDCFAEMIGALSGLASLGALSGYSLSQSAAAIRTAIATVMATQTTSSSTTTTTTTNGRSLADLLRVDADGLSFVSRMTTLAVSPASLECVQLELCQLVQRSGEAGEPYSSAVPVASLPLSWMISSTSDHRFSDLCRAVETSQEAYADCAALYPGCPRN